MKAVSCDTRLQIWLMFITNDTLMTFLTSLSKVIWSEEFINPGLRLYSVWTMNIWPWRWWSSYLALKKELLRDLRDTSMGDLQRTSSNGTWNTLIICTTQFHFILQWLMGSDSPRLMLDSMEHMKLWSIFSLLILRTRISFLKTASGWVRDILQHR